MVVKLKSTKKRKIINDNNNAPDKKVPKREQHPFLIHWKDRTSGDNI